jgi:hypothetical protein
MENSTATYRLHFDYNLTVVAIPLERPDAFNICLHFLSIIQETCRIYEPHQNPLFEEFGIETFKHLLVLIRKSNQFGKQEFVLSSLQVVNLCLVQYHPWLQQNHGSHAACILT